MHKYTYGWKSDTYDPDDHPYAANPYVAANLPVAVDLRPQCPIPLDQGNLGSCTANAIVQAIAFDQLKQGLAGDRRSRLFVYYNERVLEDSVDTDAGAMIRDGIKSVHKQGACLESEWEYDIARFAERPPEQCYLDAQQHVVTSYKRISHSLTQMKSCLASGYPFVLGFQVYASFESDKVATTGMAPMPVRGEEKLGGHAVICVGYQTDKQLWICENSWGTEWGDHGFFYLPFPYLQSSKLSDDFWVINATE